MLGIRRTSARHSSRRCILGACIALSVIATAASELLAQHWPIPEISPANLGQILFVRQWLEHDPRSYAGDGLGPMFNANSCVACHNQGGPGGSGSREHNVDVLCLVPTRDVTRIDRKQFASDAGRIHPAFVVNETTARPMITLHRESTHPAYRARRDFLANEIAERSTVGPGSWMRLQKFQRRTPSLFGAGLIDSIADETLRQVALHQAKTTGVSGRVPAATEGGLGRFGWRGQTSTLKRFVLGACSNELGLHVPGAAQPRDPLGFSNSAPGLDLNDAQCEALTAYVASLPAPSQRQPANTRERDFWLAGQKVFERSGCADCHPPTLGDVAGIYSDLLLHDLGSELADPAGASVPGRSGITQVFDTTKYYGGMTDVFAAVPPEATREWRTPPLWGLSASGPFLHDGRAKTLDEAILAHGGEARSARNKYQSLDRQRRVELLSFLYSLGVPPGLPRIAGPVLHLAKNK
jgi:CxxC motif-containing protein (DUF1111 family)